MMFKSNKVITLDKIKSGDNFKIKKFANSNVKCISSKFGFGVGQVLKCIHKTPGGPVILQRRFQEIALGKTLTKSIEVQII